MNNLPFSCFITHFLVWRYFDPRCMYWKSPVWIARLVRDLRSATRDFTFMFWIIANDCACLTILSIPRLPRKQIELWGIKSTSGNFPPYQIQTATFHFKVYEIINSMHKLKLYVLVSNFLWAPLLIVCQIAIIVFSLCLI